MAYLQIGGPGISPLARIRPVLRRRFPALTAPFRCCLQEDGNSGSSGEEPPESLFMKELKRRGMTPTSLLEEGAAGRGVYPGMREDVRFEQEEGSGGGRGRGPRKRNGVVSADYNMGLDNQRERSLALNSGGLEGLIPRAKLLLTVGATFFLGFWPLMLIIIAIFSAMYFVCLKRIRGISVLVLKVILFLLYSCTFANSMLGIRIERERNRRGCFVLSLISIAFGMLGITILIFVVFVENVGNNADNS